jgi:predicted lipoprotein with Yx(FWY)xxD motif
MAVIPNSSPRGLTRPLRLGLRVAGAGLLAAIAAIHLDLYETGYRTIPTIGWLFLVQVIVAFVLAAAVLVSGSKIVVAAGAEFAVATLGGYLLSVWAGLFGFTEVRTTAGVVSGIIEVAAFAALAMLALAPEVPRQPAGAGTARGALRARLPAGVPGAGWSVAAASVAALVVLGVSAALAGGPAPAAGGSLKTATIGGVTVLTNARGFTLYWFAPDTATTSNCTGSCATYWPPMTGTPAAGPGVTGKLGTITRPGGATQATYNGHPLYTYVGDAQPGKANGNNLNLNGGLWHEVTTTP